ncbi:tRNA wybutosine-synthesizing protein 3 [Trypanosoma rangeli]|uniref:tRNA(Phe) 7-[(3-amino-3-carboxypropyl)-4-demethylwyosine(37)-N(4)]-methyltransferase n=1 Tax=Trypanosoma rangeli TaxID=5698 RepID=A0A3R7NUS4_TRYRA|nr:tRNA wybutosine-synthesizing protein 3 [Trypanosoma rangeli]RNF12116.1 tRNA wybutosine-synthesizing protein 3 [Trypanosoma rangeli]|eukprot:RNF12116.1 tRNA wybutosine-synthesizing protein 3 [Trypanosoma rangeli]
MALRRSASRFCPASSADAFGMAVAQPRRMPNALFMEQREKILADLRENRNDKSLAGRVDPQVASLVQFINEKFCCYVTSSSCSGRVSLFHRGQMLNTMEGQRIERKRGAFGQGALFQTHDPFSDVEGAVEHLLTPALESFSAWRKKQHDDDPLIYETELLQLKFEPMIVHVLCETMDDAARLLQCASESGQMESGVLSCSRGTSEHRKITCCITSPLCVDIPLFAQGRWLLGHANFFSPEWKSLLTNTVIHTNTLFSANEVRRFRFAGEVQRRLL